MRDSGQPFTGFVGGSPRAFARSAPGLAPPPRVLPRGATDSRLPAWPQFRRHRKVCAQTVRRPPHSARLSGRLLRERLVTSPTVRDLVFHRLWRHCARRVTAPRRACAYADVTGGQQRKGSETRAGAASETTVSLLMCGVLLLPKPSFPTRFQQRHTAQLNSSVHHFRP